MEEQQKFREVTTTDGAKFYMEAQRALDLQEEENADQKLPKAERGFPLGRLGIASIGEEDLVEKKVTIGRQIGTAYVSQSEASAGATPAPGTEGLSQGAMADMGSAVAARTDAKTENKVAANTAGAPAVSVSASSPAASEPDKAPGSAQQGEKVDAKATRGRAAKPAPETAPTPEQAPEAPENK